MTFGFSGFYLGVSQNFQNLASKINLKKKHVPFHKCGLRSGCKMPKCVTLQGV